MSWLERLLGKHVDDDTRSKGAERRGDAPVGSSGEEKPVAASTPSVGPSEPPRKAVFASVRRLCCVKCGARYSVGEDAIIVTMDMVKATLDGAVVLKPASPSAEVKKDLVSLVAGPPGERRTSVLAQAAETAGSVLASLNAGEKRVWTCYQCKNSNDYPSAEAFAQPHASASAPSASGAVSTLKAEKNAPLLKAVQEGSLIAARDTLDSGAEVNATLIGAGATPLMLATFDGHTEIVRLLLERGADVNAKVPGKNVTALMMAAQNGHSEIVKHLLERGADVNAVTNEGVTAAGIAGANLHFEIMELLARKAKKNKGHRS